MTLQTEVINSDSVTIDDAFLIIEYYESIMKASSGDDNVTQKQGCFLGLHKTADRVSLNGHWGRKNENHHKIYAYLNAAKAEDPDYTNF